MSLNLSLSGKELPSTDRSWTSTDTILYALGVGAGAEDPASELAFTTENSHRTPQQVLPTFAVALISGLHNMLKLGDIRLEQILHAEQNIRLSGSLPPAGRVHTTQRVANVYDKGANALVLVEDHCVDAVSGQPLADITTGIMVRGAGGFGGDRGPASWAGR